MENSLKQSAARGIARSLKGLVRLGLRVGISALEFEEIVRETYFACGRNDYGIRDRPTNLARVAVLTGLSRKECSRLKQKSEDDSDGGSGSGVRVRSSQNPAARVMSIWATDPRFSAAGVPQPLQMDGVENSLAALIDEQVGDIPQGAVIAELNRVGALTKTADGMVRLTQRSFLPAGLSAEKVRILANQYEDLGSTIVFNLDQVERSRLQRYVVNDHIPKDRVREFQELATALAQSLLEQLDHWLSNNEVSSSTDRVERATVRTGLGVYFFETL